MTVPAISIHAQLFRRFISYIDASPSTVRTYTHSLKQLFIYLAERGVTAPTRDDLIEYRDSLAARGLKPTTIQNYLAAARVFFAWAESEGICANAASRVRGPKISRAHKRDYLTAEQVRGVLELIDRGGERGLRDYAIIALMVTTGLRTVEVARADVGDLRPASGRPAIHVQGKGRDDRAEFVSIAADTERAIRAYLASRRDVEPSSPLFASISVRNRGDRVTARTVSGIVKARLRAAGYDSSRLSAHSLRHTAVTLALLAGRPIDEVRQFARHSSIDTTLIYSHALDAANNECSAAIAGEVFKGPM